MKRTVVVTEETTLEIDIPGDMVTPEALAEFSSLMFKVENPNDIMRHAAIRIALHGDVFIEGMGQAINLNREKTKDGAIEYKEIDYVMQAQIVYQKGEVEA